MHKYRDHSVKGMTINSCGKWQNFAPSRPRRIETHWPIIKKIWHNWLHLRFLSCVKICWKSLQRVIREIYNHFVAFYKVIFSQSPPHLWPTKICVCKIAQSTCFGTKTFYFWWLQWYSYTKVIRFQEIFCIEAEWHWDKNSVTKIENFKNSKWQTDAILTIGFWPYFFSRWSDYCHILWLIAETESIVDE